MRLYCTCYVQKKARERDRVMYCCRLWCYLEVSEIVEWSKREDMHIKFAQYIQAQEIFARWGHCHRPSAHVPLSILSKHWELSCTSLFVSLCAAKVSKQASERIYERWKKSERYLICTQIGYYVLVQMYGTAIVFFFFTSLWHCMSVHKNQNYMFTLIVLSCLVLSLIVRDCGSQIYRKITDALKELCCSKYEENEPATNR